MKKLLAAFCLCAMSVGTLSLPARADFVEINKFNHHRDYWNYRQFHNADRYYYRHHPGVEVINSRDAFRRLDRDRDGRLRTEEVRAYRSW